MMIEDFSYITEDGISLRLNLGVGVDMFEGNDESQVSSFYKGQGKGVRWESIGKIIEILEPGKKIHGRPTPDLQLAVILYPADHPVYSSPNNAVVYNVDGSIHRQLIAPQLISDLPRKRGKNERFAKYWDVFFEFVEWRKNSSGEVVMSMRIGYDREWWESRELNADTGEWGECLSSGRR